MLLLFTLFHFVVVVVSAATTAAAFHEIQQKVNIHTKSINNNRGMSRCGWLWDVREIMGGEKQAKKNSIHLYTSCRK
jgi:hypothetical protein